MNSPWLSPEGAAEYIGISVSYVYKLISTREIPSYPLRMKTTSPLAKPPVRLNVQEIDAWIMEHRREAIPASK